MGAAVVGVTSLSLAKVNSVAVGSMKANNIALQAYQYADAEAQLVRATAYNDLSAKSKADIQNSNGFQREVTVSAESIYSDTLKQKIASVKIYRSGESAPRVTLNVTRLNKELQPASGVPVGTIIAWPGSSAPTEGGTWLLCNGQSCSGYPALSAVVGSTVPNLNGRFLEGTTGSPRTFKDANLPQIPIIQGVTTTMGSGSYVSNYQLPTSGVTPYFITGDHDDGGRAGILRFHMSSKFTGSTVQPASYTVRYYIKAA